MLFSLGTNTLSAPLVNIWLKVSLIYLQYCLNKLFTIVSVKQLYSSKGNDWKINMYMLWYEYLKVNKYIE